MNIRVTTTQDSSLLDSEIEVVVKSSSGNKEIGALIEYIKQYKDKSHKTLLVNSNGVMKEIRFQEIICFYSDKKYNYLRTKEQNYKMTSKLYEIEKLDPNFIRISKACIVNSAQIKEFDLSETGQIVVVLNDGSREFVSRRKVKSIMEFFDERSV